MFVLFGGFDGSYFKVTSETYAYDTTSNTGVSTWKKYDNHLEPLGISHCAYASRGNILYSCAGYVGRHPGPGTRRCSQFDITKPSGQQWKSLPDLPAERSGGGMILDTNSNTLLYGTGASRPDPNRKIYTIDQNTFTKSAT